MGGPALGYSDFGPVSSLTCKRRGRRHRHVEAQLLRLRVRHLHRGGRREGWVLRERRDGALVDDVALAVTDGEAGRVPVSEEEDFGAIDVEGMVNRDDFLASPPRLGLVSG